ncbi:MAG: radical SAM protein [Candidatus Hydrogenedentes bacterium]|nr:radical SAM protein [Candidatus Hydrogenedentota bacterium]
MAFSERNIAVLMLHGGCNMRCLFCVTDNRLESMTLEQYTHTLDKLQREGFDNVVLGGGEPFCWPHDVAVAARLAKERGFCVQVGTNGITMPDDAAYPHWVDRYVLPMDAADPAVHNWMRPLPTKTYGHHELMHRRLEQMRRYHRSVTVSTVVSRANLNDMIPIGDYLADYIASGGTLHAWHLYHFIPEGRGGKKNAEQLSISDAEFNDAVAQARAQHYPFTLFKRPNMQHSATVDFFWYEKGELCIGSERWSNEEVVSSLPR